MLPHEPIEEARKLSISLNPAVLVERSRGDELEAEHLGSALVLSHSGELIFSAGQVDRPFFPRSAVKLFHAIPFLSSGAAATLECTIRFIP
jgi:L-asparaginase II